MLFLKAFRKGAKGAYQNNFQYPPIGKWTERSRHVEVCSSGYHVAERLDSVVSHLPDKGELYVVELDGKRAVGGGKVAFERMRLVHKLDISPPAVRKLAKRMKVSMTEYGRRLRSKEILGRILSSVETPGSFYTSKEEKENSSRLKILSKALKLPLVALTRSVPERSPKHLLKKN